MLRYSNSGSSSKPVDYYRPLTVDVSVEYELPKEVAPPKGSAPLLIIHPSAYFRSKATNQPPDKATTLSLRPASQHNARLGDIASTLYYFSTNAPAQPHINKPTHRSAIQTECNRNTRSRTAKADHNPHHTRPDPVPTRLISIHQSQHTFADLGRNDPKKAHLPTPPNHTPLDAQAYGVPSNYAYSRTHVPSVAPPCNHLLSNARTTANNKRLRMMSHQQPTPPQLHHNAPLRGGMEPLNLALTSATYNHPFSTFLGVGGQSGRSPAPNQNYAFPSAHAQQSFPRALSAAVGGKEGAVPVEKGSGSDSGVCSENDSDDVSPPMPPFASDHSARRSHLAQGGPAPGCYCCCCPGGGMGWRKGWKSAWKGLGGGEGDGVRATGGVGNYENLLNLIHQHQRTLLEECPMEASDALPYHHPHHRKWLPHGVLQEHALGNTQAPFPKWYHDQV